MLDGPVSHAPALEHDLGARVSGAGVAFTVWAPRQGSVALVLDGVGDHDMQRGQDGYFRLEVPGIGAGQRYWFRLAEGLRADPVSRFQPEGVFGPSLVVDPSSFAWTDADWPGAKPPHQQVVYELHLGTFTTGGTWAAARERLPHLAALGVTTIEVMPIAEFAGQFGWGYDGVLLFAPFHRYGTPDDARRFIDAAHAAGIAVILDVVYNHTGPVGSYLSEFSDHYLSDHESEWGRGFNLDGPHSGHVREFLRANMKAWLLEFHFDGLRFDALQSIVDASPEPLVDELTRYARGLATRPLYIVAEHERQDVGALVTPARVPRGVDSLWNEDWHHAAFVALTGRREAYFTDYAGTASEFASMARWNTLYQGQWYTWQKQRRGTDARHLPGAAFVWFLENHDQVANTGPGVRLHQMVDPALWRAMTALLLLGPGVPMLFQGQERSSPEPFTYFADQEKELAALVKAGRETFLAQFPRLRDPNALRQVPDPADGAMFRRCQLRWQDSEAGTRILRLHTDLLALRRTDPVLARAGTDEVSRQTSAPTPEILILRYEMGDDERLFLLNLGPTTTLQMNDPLLAAPANQAWRLQWSSERAEYGGSGVDPLANVAPGGATGDAGPWRLQPHAATLLRNEHEAPRR